MTLNHTAVKDPVQRAPILHVGLFREGLDVENAIDCNFADNTCMLCAAAECSCTWWDAKP